MIDTEDLCHWLTVNRLVATAQRDPYSGQLRHDEEPIRIRCFFDATVRNVELPAIGKKLKVSGTIFILPTDTVNENDVVKKIEDAMGNVLVERDLKVMGVRLYNDEEGAHHQEVYVLEDHAA